MRRKAAQCVHPSMRAASMRSPGTSSKKPIITHSTRGRATIRWVRISAVYVSIIFALVNRMNQGIR